MDHQKSAKFSAADPRVAVSNTGDPDSFAYSTVRERWPKIIQSAVSAVEHEVTKSADILSEADAAAGTRIKSQLLALEAEMADALTLKPIPHDGGSDINGYNNELNDLQSPTWGMAPWLYAECYMYRVMYTFFSTSTQFWQSFDVFRESKERSLSGSRKGTLELVDRFLEMQDTIQKRKTIDRETEKAIFEEMVQISLWGNATDLSLLTTFTMDSLTSRQGKAARDASKSNVLVDDTERVWKLLSGLKDSGATGSIHVVLDNAGFELLTDLTLIGYLLDDGYAQMIVMHGKRMPWFVSDVNRNDVDELIDGFTKSSIWQDVELQDDHQLQKAGKYWRQLMDSGKLEFRAHNFWTTQHSFGRMPVVEPELFSELAAADLVIFKGDLNYRKLTYDCMWPKTTAFSEALGPLAYMHDGNGVRVLALRTSKADVFVGLQPGQEDRLEEGWTRTGRYAVVSFHDGKT